MPKEQSVTLYLTSWQKRMIKDFMSAKDAKVRSFDRVSWMKITFVDKRRFVMYRQPIEAFKAGHWNLYLTDEQITMVAEQARIPAKFSALNVTPELVQSGGVAFG